ncbi:hypothetical protein [Bacillus sp. IT-13CA1]|uniref:hypothetical protein n=1 Tax=Bacillus sp. IT-13CA1 TaxID=3035929 RepID=UPI0039E102D4
MSKKVEVINYGEVLSQVSDFISSALNSKFIITLLTSWPLAVVLIVLLLRDVLMDKIREVESISSKYGGVEFVRKTLNWVGAKQTSSTEDNAESEDNAEQQMTGAESDEAFEYLQDQLFNPSAAVKHHWLKVESKINEAYNIFIEREIKTGASLKKYPSIKDKVNFLVDKRIISKGLGAQILGLYSINEVVYAVKIGKDEAKNFIKLCKNVVNQINDIF